MCKVSILVPICNVEIYLEQCLLSLAAQDMDEIEFICLNDGSKDSSGEIAHGFEHKDSRFRVIDKENTGYGKTMNLGLSMARGEYIGIVESDDFVEPDMFSYLYRIAKEKQVDVIKSAFWIHTSGLDIFQDVIPDSWYDKVISDNDTFEVFERNPSIWSNLYRRSFIQGNDIVFCETPGASFQDIAWRSKVFACAKKTVFVKRAFYHYRRDNENASVRDDGKLFCVCDEYDEVERFLSMRSDWDGKYQFLLPCFRWRHYYWNCFERWLSLGSRWKFFKRMRNEMIQYEKVGALRHEYWHKYDWINLQKMLADSRQFFFENCVTLWLKTIMLEGLLKILNVAPKLAVYGAGKIGREALTDLCIYGKRPNCFVVSDMSGNDAYVEGIPVRVVDDIVSEQSDYVVLIATGMGTQPEILAYLLDKGFYNVISFMPEIKQALRI